ncbi:hypothetical protein PG984_008405 [Apiospora sp. TS-2023a]
MKPILIALLAVSATAAPVGTDGEAEYPGGTPPGWGFPPGWNDAYPSPTCELVPLGVSPTAAPTGTAAAAVAPDYTQLPPCVFPWFPMPTIVVPPGLGGPPLTGDVEAPDVPTVVAAPTPATWVA